MEIITVENLSFRYPENEHPALDNISMSVSEGDFVLVCGKSGCGKTTLARHLKTVTAPVGDMSGNIYYRGRNLSCMTEYEQAAEIGYVMQGTDTQIVTDKVWHELAFGLENLGMDNRTIRRRVAETAGYFGIDEWFDRKTCELSGGQKQILNIASVMVMKPSVLVLDEPTSELCEIAANELLSLLKKLNQELGTTVIIIEHRLENIYPVADKVALLENGRLIAYGSARNVAGEIMDSEYHVALPAAAGIYRDIPVKGEAIPLSVRDGRRYIGKITGLDSGTEGIRRGSSPDVQCNKSQSCLPPGQKTEGESSRDARGNKSRSDTGRIRDNKDEEAALNMTEVYFRYEKTGKDILHNMSMRICKGKISVLLGGNGQGKTTAASVAAGILKPYRGKIRLYGNKTGMLPQNPETLFVRDKVYDDLKMVVSKHDNADRLIMETAEKLDITGCLYRHPYDLSGGEKQRAAMCKVLLSEPGILILDEPTKGFDVFHKAELGNLLKDMAGGGKAVLMVSHDIEFAAEYADMCMMLFGGGVVCEGTPAEVFAGNSFYTTAANRIAGDYFGDVITKEDVVRACRNIII